MTDIATETAQIIRDYTAVYADAVAAGDDLRAAVALATIRQAAHIAGLGLPHVPAAITHTNGVYTPPRDDVRHPR